MVSTKTAAFEFELTGGDLALDLANTRERRPTAAPEEHLRGYADLVAWGVQAKAIGPQQAARLRVLAARRPQPARAALARALELREAVFGLFSALTDSRPLPPALLARLNASLPPAMAELRLTPESTGAAWTWNETPHLDRILWPVARAAAELLTSTGRERVRKCAARDCDWLFLDQSRNATRRWCDMTICGNREKARRFQDRSRRPRR
jgi:predicted RNA-binding Zn ribbon-like protein